MFNKKLLRNLDCKQYDIVQNFEIKILQAINFDFKLNDDYDELINVNLNIFDEFKFHVLQTTHIVVVHNVYYNNNVDFRYNIIDTMLTIFR